jgi:hypothetical protein
LQGVLAAESSKWKTSQQELERKINDLTQQVQAAKASPQTAAPPADAKDLDTYGPEMIDLINRRASEIVAKQMEALQPQLEQTRAQVTELAQRQYQSAEDEFYGELEAAVPDWKAINADQRFIDWLAEVDPMFGVSRQTAMDHAARVMSHAQAASLFNAYKTASGMNKPATPAPAAKAQVSPSPRTVGTSSAPSMREPEVTMKRSDITAHYARAARDPAYRGTADYKAFEVRMTEALAANKIIEA